MNPTVDRALVMWYGYKPIGGSSGFVASGTLPTSERLAEMRERLANLK